MIAAALSVFRRELRLAARKPAEWAQPLLFYGIVGLLFPLGIEALDPALHVFAPAIVWVGALLAALLGLERMFRGDLEDGWLEQLLLSDAPAPLLVTAKFAAHWLLTALPLVLAAPLMGLALGLAPLPLRVLTLSLLLGTPSLMFTGGFAAALTVGAPRAGLLVPILSMPLMVPAACLTPHRCISSARCWRCR